MNLSFQLGGQDLFLRKLEDRFNRLVRTLCHSVGPIAWIRVARAKRRLRVRKSRALWLGSRRLSSRQG